MTSRPPPETAEQLRRQQQWLSVLGDVMRAFAEASTDPQRLLETIAYQAARVIHDYCSVHLLSEGAQSLTLAALHHVLISDSFQRFEHILRAPIPLSASPLMAQVVSTSESLLIPRLDLEQLRPSAAPGYFTFLQETGVHSVLVVPLRVQGRPLGVMVLMRHQADSRPFDRHDQGLAQLLADHAALAISNARLYAEERRMRQAAESARAELARSEQMHRLVFEKNPVPMAVVDMDSLEFVSANEAALRLYGYTMAELRQLHLPDLRFPGEVPQAPPDLYKNGHHEYRATLRHRRKDGSAMVIELTSRIVFFEGRLCRLGVVNDVTEKHKLEEQLRQAQKMEAVGRLAGGVAHDFNNVLTVVLSYADMLLEELTPEAPMHDDIEQIRQAARRASDLTQQLLAFSRQQVIAPRVLDLNRVLGRMGKMLQRLLGEDIELALQPGSPLGAVRADPTSLEQIVLNLAVNARDAMPRGGRLLIETCDVELDEDHASQHLGVAPGPYVMLAVTDTGTGMDKATQERIFEPFFTTKDKSKGTGLGLATVHGIVQQNGGNIWVYSEPGVGTTFKVYLPRVTGPRSGSMLPPPSMSHGTETILLVEDDRQVRTVALEILRKHGYEVLEAGDASQALAHAEQHQGPIHLLLSDVVMPRMSGPELAVMLTARRPTMKVLWMSGYTDDSVLRHGVITSRLEFLPKPLTPASLTRRVREVLDDAP